MDKYVEKAKQIVVENIYMTIATASIDGTPWVSPVFFAYDDQYNLYWVSNKDARHSKYIEANPQVAITIFDSRAPEGEGDGIYFECNVEILQTPQNITQAMEILNKRITHDEFKIKSVEQCVNKAPWRVYRAVPKIIYKLTEGKYVKGQYIDEKVEIKL